MKIQIKNNELVAFNGCETPNFPKYTAQLINCANQNAQGTRPRIVGQLSELFPEYEEQADEITIEDWENWYLERHPNAINNATDKIFTQIENLKEAIKLIDKPLVRQWVEDLVIAKTYNGLYVQEAILSKIADSLGREYRLATPSEEAQGIDGFVGETPYSIKPDSYKTMGRLPETIAVKMIYYTKNKTGLLIEIEE